MTGVTGKPSLLWINEGKVGPGQPPVEIYDSEAHLVAVLKQAVADGLRCFVTSNSKTKIATIAAALEKEFGSERRLIVVTADTGGTEEVVDFIGDVATRTLEYDVILTSPSLGTGVDISFPEQAKLIDVVFGFFEAQITTHFDCDQQLGRVRHPKAIKVWINPRRFQYETSFEVVKHDLLRESLYKNLLVGYANGEPVYNEEDEFITMAALILSQQRASKNNLKRHFIEYKKHQGYTIRTVAADQAMSAAGRALRKIGKELDRAQLAEALLAASPLRKGEFDDLRERLEGNDTVSPEDMWDFQRTRLELFYRQRVSADLISLDDQGRYRDRVELFGFVSQFETQPYDPTLSERSRFLRSDHERTKAVVLLLRRTPLFSEGQFHPNVTLDLKDLEAFSAFARDHKAELETLLGIEVRTDVDLKPVQQLNAVLKLVGLRVTSLKPRKESGRKVYPYRLDAEAIDRIRGIKEARDGSKAWEFLYGLYGWDPEELRSEGEMDLWGDPEE